MRDVAQHGELGLAALQGRWLESGARVEDGPSAGLAAGTDK